MRKVICLLLVFLISCLFVLPATAAPEGPEITLQPQSPNYPEYSVAIYTVKAEGTNLTATWYIEWQGKTYAASNIGGSMQPWESFAGEAYGARKLDNNTFAFIFEGIEYDLDGAYIWCVIEDGHYDVTSQKARISVGNPNTPPEIISIPSQITVEQGTYAEIRCVAKAPDGTQLSFLWYESDTGRMEDIRAVNRGTETTDYLICDTSYPGVRNYICFIDTSDGGFANTSFGIYTSADGCYHYEQWYADDFIPYYIHTAGGSHYIYLFSRELEGAFPQMSLVVFDITGGQYHRVGEKNVGPGYIPTDNYRVPTDPNNLWLDDFDGMAQDSMAYAVGSMGMPELKSGESSESQIVFAPERMEMLTVHKEALNRTSWVGYAMVNSESAESFPLPYTEPDGTVICVSMELNADGSGWLEFKNKRETITWDCDGAYSVWIVREDGQRADMTAYAMGGENHVWLLIDLNGYLLWLY